MDEAYDYRICQCAGCASARKREAIKASEKRAVDELKRLVGVADVKRALNVLNYNAVADAFYPKPYSYPWDNPLRYAMGKPFEYNFMNQVETKQEPKHKRKATKIVTKQAMNEPARMHADEANDMIEEARDLLRAADAFDGMRIFDVVVPEEKQWNGKHAITIILEKIEPEEDTSLAEELEDKTLMYAYKNGMVAVANRIRSVLQQSGRKLLLDATLSMHRLVAPEMAAAVAIENAGKMEANVVPSGVGTGPKTKAKAA